MEITCLTRLGLKVVYYYAQKDATQIAHTQSVTHYTTLLAEAEGYTPRQVTLLTAAALLHDIGCPQAKEKFGNSKPVHQMKEGIAVATQILEEFSDDEFSREEKQWIVEVVGKHHRFADAQRLNFLPLFEADLIVNFFEDYFSINRAPQYYERLMTTATGRDLFQKFFLTTALSQ